MCCLRRRVKRMPAEDRFGRAAAAHGDFVDLKKVAPFSVCGGTIGGGAGKGEGKAGLLAEGLQPRRKIDRVADNRIGQAGA